VDRNSSTFDPAERPYNQGRPLRKRQDLASISGNIQ
jgi:hypothetical protein